MEGSGEPHHSSKGSEKTPKRNASDGLKRNNAIGHGETNRKPGERLRLNREFSIGDDNTYTVRGVKTFSIFRDDTLPKSPTLPSPRSKSVPPNLSRNSMSSTTASMGKASGTASGQDQVAPGTGKLRRGPKLSLQTSDDQRRVPEQAGRREATVQTMEKVRPKVVFNKAGRDQRHPEGGHNENPAVVRPRTEDRLAVERANERRPQDSPIRPAARTMKPSPLRESTSTSVPPPKRDEEAVRRGPLKTSSMPVPKRDEEALHKGLRKTSSLPVPERGRPRPEPGQTPPPLPPRPNKGQKETLQRRREDSPSGRRPASGRDRSPGRPSRFCEEF